ncbi:MAG: hypothetical protein H6Q02_1083 [Acidobacteria bacterium]|nr:hypothetical protein [Acidobacteriota bacterium]
MKRAISFVLLVAMTATAVADPHKILVLQTEGRADAATRLKIDATIAKLATADGAQVSPGDITFTDAAAAVGCKPEVAACRDEVLGMLAVDEVIYATTALKPGGIEIEVHRVTLGGTMRDGKMLLATGQSADTLDGLAPLFTDGTTTEPVTPQPTEPAPTVLPPATEPQPSPITTQPAVAPIQVDEGGSQMRRRLLLTGIVGGGALMVIGFLLWGEAGTIQEEIDTHPTNTAAQLDDLKQLETRGDSYAAWGNVLFLGGAAIGGISAYFYAKHRKARATRTARIGPALFDHGAGITLTIGGSP